MLMSMTSSTYQKENSTLEISRMLERWMEKSKTIPEIDNMNVRGKHHTGVSMTMQQMKD